MPRKKCLKWSSDLPVISPPPSVRFAKSGHVCARTRGVPNAMLERWHSVHHAMWILQNTTNTCLPTSTSRWSCASITCGVARLLSTALAMVSPCLQRVVVAGIDSCLPWQVPSTNNSHSITLIRARSPPLNGSNTAEQAHASQ